MAFESVINLCVYGSSMACSLRKICSCRSSDMAVKLYAVDRTVIMLGCFQPLSHVGVIPATLTCWGCFQPLSHVGVIPATLTCWGDSGHSHILG